MEKELKKEEKSFELRSEKVRSIVGQIPSSLLRYGTMIIGIVILCLFVIAYYLPYKRVYSGTAVIREITFTKNDSTEISVLLRFDGSRPKGPSGLTLNLQSERTSVRGRVLALSPTRDTLERQESLCLFKTEEIRGLEHQSTDFSLVESSGSILRRFIYPTQ